jgi:hypothetical protein
MSLPGTAMSCLDVTGQLGVVDYLGAKEGRA